MKTASSVFAALGAALLLGVAPTHAGADSPETRPNILWLVAEDLSPIVPPYGDRTVATPNLGKRSK